MILIFGVPCAALAAYLIYEEVRRARRQRRAVDEMRVQAIQLSQWDSYVADLCCLMGGLVEDGIFDEEDVCAMLLLASDIDCINEPGRELTA